MLTKRQSDLLTFINNYTQTYSYAPSFQEMADAMKLKSKSGIHRLISGLVERGFIRQLPHRARAIQVLKLPEDIFREAGKLNA